MGVRARDCTEQRWRALPCFIFWAGPGLIPYLPRGLSGAHTEGDGALLHWGGKQGGPVPLGLGRAEVRGSCQALGPLQRDGAQAPRA